MDVRSLVFDTPWYDTHCHIGCMDPIGHDDGPFVCDTVRGCPLPALDLWGLLHAPYLQWSLWNLRVDTESPARQAGFASSLDWVRAEPDAWMTHYLPHYKRIRTMGIFRSTARGVRELHGVTIDLDDPASLRDANDVVHDAYRRHGFYGWWARAARNLNCVRCVKLVEPTYVTRNVADHDSWAAEEALVVPALRVDSLTTLHLSPSQRGYRFAPATLGIEAPEWDDYGARVDQLLDGAAAFGIRAVKNAYAYAGPLQLPPEDLAAADRYVREATPGDYRAFEGAVLRRVLRWAEARGMPYQMHAGMTPIPGCNPTQLQDQIMTHPQTRFVLLHIYPYIREAGCMAAFQHNVYLDPCWQSLLSAEILRASLREWLGLIAAEKLLFGIDATTVEEWYGAALIAKEVLADVLAEKIERSELLPGAARDTVRQVLYENPHAWYGEGSEIP